MTDVRSNMFGKYSENDLRQLTEESRIMEMRWQVFEGLYDTTRQELEKTQSALIENVRLRQQVDGLLEETTRQDGIINHCNSIIEDARMAISNHTEETEAFRKLSEEAIIENEKLHKQIALYIDPLKELENVVEPKDL